MLLVLRIAPTSNVLVLSPTVVACTVYEACARATGCTVYLDF